MLGSCLLMHPASTALHIKGDNRQKSWQTASLPMAPCVGCLTAIFCCMMGANWLLCEALPALHESARLAFHSYLIFQKHTSTGSVAAHCRVVCTCLKH